MPTIGMQGPQSPLVSGVICLWEAGIAEVVGYRLMVLVMELLRALNGANSLEKREKKLGDSHVPISKLNYKTFRRKHVGKSSCP